MKTAGPSRHGTKMAENTIRLGLLGCGPIAQAAHLPALRKCESVVLTAVCDAADDLLQRVAPHIAAKDLFTDYDAFLQKADIDVVLIATADQYHVPLATKALHAGKHVLVEKPLGTNSQQCAQLAELADSTGLKLQVGNMKRHDAGIAFARRFVREHVGQVLSVSAWYRDAILRPEILDALVCKPALSNASIGPSEDPRADKRRYSLVTHGVHLFDTVAYLAGPPGALTAKTSHMFDQDTWHGLIEFRHGGIGHFELSVKLNWDWSEGYAVYGERGSVEIRTFLPCQNRPSEVRAFDAEAQTWTSPLSTCGDAYKNQLDAFADAVLNDRPTNPDARDGLADVRMLEAVEESVRTGRRIELD